MEDWAEIRRLHLAEGIPIKVIARTRAAAVIDRIVHHAEVITLKGASYRLKDNGIATLPPARADNQQQSDD